MFAFLISAATFAGCAFSSGESWATFHILTHDFGGFDSRGFSPILATAWVRKNREEQRLTAREF
jgi:hypothetical protein